MGVNKLSSLDLFDAFSSMSNTELSNYKYLSSFIFNKCGLIFSRKVPFNCPDPAKLNCWGGINARQYPDELAKLLVFIYNNKFKINSYCEIGIDRGGTFFIIDSFLRSVNPNMGESLGIDKITTPGRDILFRKYSKKFPKVEIRIINSENLKPKKYDLCFIDGDHKYFAIKKDFELMKPFSKYIAIHDIKLDDDSGEKNVKIFWAELEGDKTEFLNEDNLFPLPVGMGLWKKNIKFSMIAPAIRDDLYLPCYESLNEKNKIPFEMIFVGNSPPPKKMPINFRYIYTNVGPSQCLEIAAQASSGEYLICTTDDLLLPSGFLNKIDFYLSKLHMEKVLVGNRYQINGVFRGGGYSFRKEYITSPVVPFMPAFKREVWEELGGIDKRFSFAYYDLDMMLRFYEIGYRPFIIPDNWGNEIWSKDIVSGLCRNTGRAGSKLLKRFWIKEYQGKRQVVRNRKEPVESFDDKNILTVNQNVFWGKK